MANDPGLRCELLPDACYAHLDSFVSRADEACLNCLPNYALLFRIEFNSQCGLSMTQFYSMRRTWTP
jgi:hypothetical protein